jgi:hypothetical protein
MFVDAMTAAERSAAFFPSPRTSDRLTPEHHWRDICSELTSPESLAKTPVE